MTIQEKIIWLERALDDYVIPSHRISNQYDNINIIEKLIKKHPNRQKDLRVDLRLEKEYLADIIKHVNLETVDKMSQNCIDNLKGAIKVLKDELLPIGKANKLFNQQGS